MSEAKSRPLLEGIGSLALKGALPDDPERSIFDRIQPRVKNSTGEIGIAPRRFPTLAM